MFGSFFYAFKLAEIAEYERQKEKPTCVGFSHGWNNVEDGAMREEQVQSVVFGNSALQSRQRLGHSACNSITGEQGRACDHVRLQAKQTGCWSGSYGFHSLYWFNADERPWVDCQDATLCMQKYGGVSTLNGSAQSACCESVPRCWAAVYCSQLCEKPPNQCFNLGNKKPAAAGFFEKYRVNQHLAERSSCTVAGRVQLQAGGGALAITFVVRPGRQNSGGLHTI